MMETIAVEPLSATAFAPFGAVIEAHGAPTFLINEGLCGRYHDLARPIANDGGAIAVSVGRSDAVFWPLSLSFMERHPLGSQAFVPMNGTRFVVTVSPDELGGPGRPRAFLTNGVQGIQYNVGCWHGTLAPLIGPSDFVIIDRIGDDTNLEEYRFDDPYAIALKEMAAP